MDIRILLAALAALPTYALAEITFYEHTGFRGRSFTITDEIRNFDRLGFNDKAKSAIVGQGRYEVCADSQFRGDCRILTRGSYDSLKGIGMDGRISSVRPVNTAYEGSSMAPTMSTPDYNYYRRPHEQVFQARVVSSRAVYGPPEQRCWTEQETTTDRRANVGGAVLGAVLGGVLGHQIGGGRGKDVATAAGAVAGAALGSRAGGGNDNTYVRDVQKCRDIGSGPPLYWDVAYEFDGQQHHAQLASPPGEWITVNQRGEPRQ